MTVEAMMSQCPDGHSLFFHGDVTSLKMGPKTSLNALTGILCFSTAYQDAISVVFDLMSQCPDGHSLFFHVAARAVVTSH